MQFFKEELNDDQEVLEQTQRPDNGSLPAAGGNAPTLRAAARRRRPSRPLTRILPASITPPIPITSRKISTWPSRDSGNSSAIFPKAAWPTIPCTGSANAHYAKKKYQDAINTFNELLAKYKDGDKVPAAILKKGYALLEMGRQSEGIAILKELISRFPLSEEASLAQQKIKEFSE